MIYWRLKLTIINIRQASVKTGPITPNRVGTEASFFWQDSKMIIITVIEYIMRKGIGIKFNERLDVKDDDDADNDDPLVVTLIVELELFSIVSQVLLIEL